MAAQSATKAMIDHTFVKNQFDFGLEEAYNQIRILEPLVTSALSRTTEQLGTSLIGLEYSVKTASSVEDKLQRKQKQSKKAGWEQQGKPFSPEEELLRFKDILRYTEICEHDAITETTQKTIDAMTGQNYMLSGVKNYYTHPFPTTGYKGIHLNFISPYGQEIEVQVHSESSFSAKQHGHELYEKIRSVSTPKNEKETLAKELRQIHEAVNDPPGITTIHDFAMDMQEKRRLMDIGRTETTVHYETKKTKDGVEIARFSVYQQNTAKVPASAKYMDGRLLEGAEIQYPDRSVFHCHQNHKDKEPAIMYTLAQNGEMVEAVQMDKIPMLHLPDLKRLADKTIQEHTQWMRSHFPEPQEAPEQTQKTNSPSYRKDKAAKTAATVPRDTIRVQETRLLQVKGESIKLPEMPKLHLQADSNFAAKYPIAHNVKPYEEHEGFKRGLKIPDTKDFDEPDR